jgi:cyclic pyranopterin phosphate synthase
MLSSLRLQRGAARVLWRAFSSNDEKQQFFLEQMLELQEEREAQYGFTEEEQQAWSKPPNHSQDFLESINQAREQLVSLPDDDDDDDDNDAGAFVDFDTKPIRRAPSQLTHVSKDGGATMVDIGSKQATRRVAIAQCRVVFPPEVMNEFIHSDKELVGPKGPIFATAKLAGIMAAKRTSDLIPLCHPLPLDKVDIDIVLSKNVALITCECCVTHKTGVEMEALTGATIAALTIYDMVKAISHEVTIQDTVLIRKTGGKRAVNPDKEQAE